MSNKHDAFHNHVVMISCFIMAVVVAQAVKEWVSVRAGWVGFLRQPWLFWFIYSRWVSGFLIITNHRTILFSSSLFPVSYHHNHIKLSISCRMCIQKNKNK